MIKDHHDLVLQENYLFVVSDDQIITYSQIRILI